jgi:dipeptidyl aminopeptidase/acylaminoacyl peptidase
MTSQIPSALLSRRNNFSTHYQLVVPELDNIVTILSVARDGQVLMGREGRQQLYVYSEDGYLVTTVTVPFDDRVIDAVWSPREHHIVCTTDKTQTTVVMSLSGDDVHHTQMIAPQFLSVSLDNEIYVTSTTNGINYSTDNGTSWNILVSKRESSWEFTQALKVTPNSDSSNYTVWIIEHNFPKWRLSIYTPDKCTWKDVVLPNAKVQVDFGKMTFDGHTQIYMADWSNNAVHVWSEDGKYVRLKISLYTYGYHLQNVAMNKQSTMLYVAEDGVKVFALQN